MDGIFGLAAFGFWMFIAAAAVGGIWDGVRKRDAQHETLRRLIESGKQPDPELIDKVLAVSGERTKKAAVTKALQEYLARRQQRRVLELFGKLEWDPDFDYKAKRSRT